MFYTHATRPALQRTTLSGARNAALDKLLSETLSAASGARTGQAASVEDGDTAYTLQLDVPGLSREQLEIGIEGDVVRITSKADAARTVKAAYRFPLEIDAQTSSARLENGVLSLSLAKNIPVSKVSTLTIS